MKIKEKQMVIKVNESTHKKVMCEVVQGYVAAYGRKPNQDDLIKFLIQKYEK